MARAAVSFQLSDLDGTNGFRLEGFRANLAIVAVSSGDVNNDGFDDLVVGAAAADLTGHDSGATYVVFGKASGFASNILLSSLGATAGFRIDGAAAEDWSGIAVSAAGDVNGDGFDDIP